MDEGQQLELGVISERFPRKVHIVAGPTELVQAALRDLLAAIPEKFTLYQNYPNPFNPTTTLRFGLPQASNIEFKIINILGQEVATIFSGWQDMGFYEYRWSGLNDLGQQVSNGVYFSQPSNIEFKIINILGQEVVTIFSGWQDMGFYDYRWSGMNALGQQVSNGVYFAVLTNGRAVKVRKMLLVK